MKTNVLVLALALTASCSTVPFKPRPAVQLGPEVTGRGETIYFGSTFPLKGAGAEPLYVYERRVAAQPDGSVIATHLTREPGGAVALADTATHDQAYALAEYTLLANQLGQTGSVRVAQGQVSFRLVDDAGEHTATERQSDPVVVGPTLVGFVFTHLEALRAGQVFPVRFAVLERLETIGFQLSQVEAPAGLTRIKMAPSGFLYSLLIAPIHFTFETATGKLVRLEGRVPPKVREGEGWADLDARVEYRFVAAAYR